MSWRTDATTVRGSPFVTTPEGDETIAINMADVLIDDDLPSLPTSVLTEIDSNDEIPLEDSPTISGVSLLQRIRNLRVGVYRMRFTISTSGNVRPLTLIIVCVA